MRGGTANRKLTNGEARYIRERVKAGATMADMARKWGMGKVGIARLCNGETYRDAGGPIREVKHSGKRNILKHPGRCNRCGARVPCIRFRESSWCPACLCPPLDELDLASFVELRSNGMLSGTMPSGGMDGGWVLEFRELLTKRMIEHGIIKPGRRAGHDEAGRGEGGDTGGTQAGREGVRHGAPRHRTEAQNRNLRRLRARCNGGGEIG